MSEQPRRRHVLEVKIGADSIDDIVRALNEIRDDIIEDSILVPCVVINRVQGGPSCGYTAKGSTDDSVTHDSYFASIDRWLAEIHEVCPMLLEE